MAATADEQANPWRLLSRKFDDGAIPAIADQTTLMYVLHLGIGDDFVLNPDGPAPIRLRIVGALADSVLQSELDHRRGRFRPAVSQGRRLSRVDD